MRCDSRKIRIAAVCLCILFVLTTAIGLLALPVRAFADGNDSETVNMLKFKQVAAGEDFAVALTYDGDVYGWSWNDAAPEKGYKQGAISDTDTLGTYYPKTPVRIDFDFRGVTGSGSSVAVGAESNKISDTVVQIAATRHTAAAVTEKGYIYVWGKEDEEPSTAGAVAVNLLLRPASARPNYYNNSLPSAFAPALIDYSEVTALSGIFSGDTKVLEGGAFNYVAYNGANSYIWGQSVYNLLNQSATTEYFNKNVAVQVFTGQRLYAGDGNTFHIDSNNSNTISVRGKNYGVSASHGNASSFSPSAYNFSASCLSGGTYGTANTDKIAISNALLSGTGIHGSLSNITLKATTAQFEGLEDGFNLAAISAGAGYAYVLQESGAITKVGNGVSESVPSGTDYVQAVAGRILSGKPILEMFGDVSGTSVQTAQPNTAKWEQKSGSTEYTLKSEYIDGTDYISAALNASGEVTVWGHKGTAITATTLTDELKAWGVSGDHKVAALFGGYADNLFMLTNLGKIIRVQATSASTLSVTQYDAFTYVGQNNQVVDIQNWDVVANATSATPTVEFNAGVYDTKVVGAQASATVSLNSITAVGTGATDDEKLQSARSYVKINGNSLASADSLEKLTVQNKIVRLNNAGDAYRMILPTNEKTDSDNNNAYSSTENISVTPSDKTEETLQNIIGTTPANVGKLSFYWNSSKTGTNDTAEIPAHVAFRYFQISYTYNETDKDVSFTITPKRSTQGRAIVMRFWVGRYDYTEKFGIGGTAKRFYDFKPVEISIKIGNTPFESVFTSATGAEGNEKSSLPLLDANNPYNKYYSIAVLDVSAGLDEIRKTLDKNGVSGFDDSTNSNAITKLITDAVDRGFPAKSKVSAGDLAYYGQADYYNNEYPYLAKDRDGDLLWFNDINDRGSTQGSNAYFDYATQTVSVPIAFSVPAEKEATIRALFTSDSAANRFMEFDNTYGLTLALTGTEGTSGNVDFTLTVSYQVLRITAKSSMGKEWVSYTDNNIGTPSLTMLAHGSNNRNGLDGTVLRPNIGDRAGDAVTLDNSTDENNRALEIFTQSSLRLSGTKLGGNAGSIYGKVTKNGSSYTYSKYTSNDIVFSIRDRTSTIRFADFFDNTDNITVAYSNVENKPVVGDEAWSSLENSFGKGVAPFDVSVEHPSSSVLATSLRLTAHRAVENYRMDIELRRLLPSVNGVNESYLLSEGTGADAYAAEVIVIRFNVTVTFAKDELFTKTDGTLHTSYNNPETVQITSRMKTDPTFLREYCTVKVSSSRPTVAQATVDEDNNTLRFALLSSGTTYIEYTVTVNASNGAYVYKDSFQLNVITLVSLPKTVNVSSREEVSLDDLKNEISRVMSSLLNNTGSDALYLDKTNPEYPNGYYFEQTSGTSAVDSENEWEKIGSIPFLDVSLGEDDKFIGMRIKQYNAAQTQSITRIVMLFTDGTSHYSASFRVAPAAIVMKDKVDGVEGGDLVLEINKGENTISIANRGDNGVQAAENAKFKKESGAFVLPWDFFAKAIDNDIVNKEYDILVVRAQSFDGTVNYSKYVNAMPGGSSDEVRLTPLYPTDGCNVQVTIRQKGVANATVTTLNFTLRITGIKTVLSASEYRTVLMAVFFSVLALLIIIFFIRMGVYWRKKAEQRRIIKKNQTLIKMRDKMHNKTEAVSKEKLVHTKLKMEDPKYAKMFSEMRKEKEAQTGISLENSAVAEKAERKAKAAKASKKKKGGKKSLEEMKAELAAKREAVARMQMGDFSGMPDMAAAGELPVDSVPVDGIAVDSVPLDEQVPVFDAEAGFEGMTAEELDAQFKAAMGENSFDTENNNDNGEQG